VVAIEDFYVVYAMFRELDVFPSQATCHNNDIIVQRSGSRPDKKYSHDTTNNNSNKKFIGIKKLKDKCRANKRKIL
jgi:hypothetical protein